MAELIALLQEIPAPAVLAQGWPWSVGILSREPVLPDGRSWPKISLVTPSFNQGAFLEKTIRSVLLQGYPNLEYIVIDGGSTDHSLEILKKYEPWLTTCVSEADRGQSHAINKGFSNATGELLGWLNSDDYFMPGALFALAEAYLEDCSVGAVYGRGDIVNEQGEVVLAPNLTQVSEQNLFEWFSGGAEFMQPSCLFTREAWQQCGPLSEDLHFAMDLDFWINIAKKFDFRSIDELLSISLKHEQAKTTVHKELSRIDVAIVYAKHGNVEQARKELDRLLDKLIACRGEIDFIHSLPLVHRIIRFFKNRRSGSGQ